MTMPMTGLRGGERLHNDDSRLALRRPACGSVELFLLRTDPFADPIRLMVFLLGRRFSSRETNQLRILLWARRGTVRLRTNYQQKEIRDFRVAHPTTEQCQGLAPRKFGPGCLSRQRTRICQCSSRTRRFQAWKVW